MPGLLSMTTLRKTNGLHAGWVDISIRELVESEPKLLSGFAYAMLTIVDSVSAVNEIPSVQRLLASHPDYALVGSSLLMPARDFSRISSELNLLTGFGEVWWFDAKPAIEKPTDIDLVGPLNLNEDPVPEALPRWMAESGCRLGVGDGIGLNFVTSDEAVARQLAAMFPPT